MPLTREEIRCGYLYVLGRDPESERVYDLFANHASVLDFRRTLIRSDEGQRVMRSQLPITVKHPYFDLDRVAVCFIHLEKTGGTSLYEVLKNGFDPQRITSSHLAMDALHSLSLSEITKYDLIAGHFDYATTIALPRPQIKRIALFRDPIDRLISFYRFHKAHPIAKRRMNFVELAQDLTPMEFFRHERVRSSPRLNNAYLRTFGTCLSLPVASETKGNETSESRELAATRIRELDAVGITERMQESVTLICGVLGFFPPDKMHRHHRTDDFATRNQGFSKPEPIERSAELEAAMEPLISMDLDLYRVAKETFSSRLAALNKERSAQ
jgi:Sulfotransferase family